MPNNDNIHELTARVAVLEEQARQAEQKIARLRADVDSCNDSHLANTGELRQKIEVLADMVDELRMSTELIKQVVSGIDKLSDKIDSIQAQTQEQASKWQRARSWAAGAMFVATAFWAGKDYVLAFLGLAK